MPDSTLLDLEQLKSVTMEDAELMRELLETLIHDTTHQLLSLEQAIRQADAKETARLAHYSKGACANVGALSSAHLFQEIERRATQGDFQACMACLPSLRAEFERLENEAARLPA